MIRTRAEVLKEIQNRPKLARAYGNWKPERLERFLSLIFRQTVKIRRILPTDNSRIAEENSLLVMDILIEMRMAVWPMSKFRKLATNSQASAVPAIPPTCSCGIQTGAEREGRCL